jgi:hypothetical protein
MIFGVILNTVSFPLHNAMYDGAPKPYIAPLHATGQDREDRRLGDAQATLCSFLGQDAVSSGELMVELCYQIRSN